MRSTVREGLGGFASARQGTTALWHHGTTAWSLKSTLDWTGLDWTDCTSPHTSAELAR
ncbi:hypothetical protein BC567DRAFT_213988 [Phyllosticta citribraziliensis]